MKIAVGDTVVDDQGDSGTVKEIAAIWPGDFGSSAAKHWIVVDFGEPVGVTRYVHPSRLTVIEPSV